jgi:hypothetical protein
MLLRRETEKTFEDLVNEWKCLGDQTSFRVYPMTDKGFKKHHKQIVFGAIFEVYGKINLFGLIIHITSGLNLTKVKKRK